MAWFYRNPLTSAAIDALVSRLSDSDVGGLLLRQLQAAVVTVPTAEKSGTVAKLMDTADHTATATKAHVIGAVLGAPATLAAQITAITDFGAGLGWVGAIKFVGVVVAAAVAGWIAEWLKRRTGNFLLLNGVNSPADFFLHFGGAHRQLRDLPLGKCQDRFHDV